MRGYAVVSVGSFALGALVSGLIFGPDLMRRTALASVAHELVRRVQQKPYSLHDYDPVIECWGDSLTAGAGTTPGHDFPSILQQIFHRPAINEGVGGETSSQVAARMLKRNKPEGAENAVIWVGRNNFYATAAVLSDIAKMIKSLNKGSHYVIIGIINSDLQDESLSQPGFEKIEALNDKLHYIYGSSFIDIRKRLIARGNSKIDQDNISRSVVPRSLRSDHLHLNDAGENIVADAVDGAMNENGW